MADSILSSSWYRVARLRPRLRPHARFYRHSYRGRTWFVLHDPVTGSMHQLSAGARLVLNGMDGTRTVQQLWEFACRQLGEDAPSQDELIQVLGQLHASDLLQSGVTADVSELFERHRKKVRGKWLRMIGNPMAVKFPLFDPEWFLTALMRYVRPLWNRWGALFWLAVVLPALVLAIPHWTELTENLSDRILGAGNLVLLFLLFPLIKALHEVGHGIAVKARGGEVHETGVMLLVLMPVPYVDASAASAFHSKWERALVGAAGMLVELFLAAIAVYVWLAAEPGIVRSLAFNVIFIAGVSTILFNANPLLRFDGYYILSDLIEIPNLAARANRYCLYLLERYAFGLPELRPPSRSAGERIWYVIYAVLSFAYRLFITFGIVLFIAGEYFVIGVLLAIWGVVTMIGIPLWKAVQYLTTSPKLEPRRGRVRATVFGVLSLAALLIFVMPAPFRTQTEGVIWLPEHAIVRAGSNGFFNRFLAAPGTRVSPGDIVAEYVDPALEAQVSVAEAKVAELKASYAHYFVNDRVQAEVVRQQLDREETALHRLIERAAELLVKSGASGVFVVPRAADVEGRFFRKGDLLGYVVGEERPVVRVVVAQGEIDVVRLETLRVAVRSAHRIDRILKGGVVRHVPGGSDQLPSPALGPQGGGAIATDPRDTKGVTALQRVFQFDVDVDLPEAKDLIGGRAYVRFEHRGVPIATQAYRSLRRLFLARFNV